MAHDFLAPADDESLVRRASNLFWRRRTLSVVVFASVVASAICFAKYLPDLYRASATLLVERAVPEAYVRTAVTGELESRLHVIKQEILSRPRMTELVERFNLYPELRQREPLDAVLDQMRHDIAIETTGPEQVSGRKTTVGFKLSYTGAKGETVADVANALATFYVAQNDHIRSQEATRLTEFLKSQLDATRKQLDRHEDGMRAYTSTHSGELPQQVEVNLAALERLNTQLRLNGERQMRILDDREKLAEVTPFLSADATPAERAAAAIAPTFPGADRLDRMKRDLQMAEAQGTSRHPDVIRLKSEIAALERERQDFIVKEREEQKEAAAATPTPAAAPEPTDAAPPSSAMRRRTLAGLDAELEKLRGDESALRANISNVERRLEGVPSRQQEFGRLTRDYQANKDLYDSLLKRFDEAQLSESLEADRQGESFRILETAVPPSGPMAPNRLQLIILGVLLGIAAAALAALVAEQFDSSFHSIDDLRRVTRVPVLATISAIRPRTASRAVHLGLTAATVLVAIAAVVALSTYVARDNAQLVWMLTRGT